MLESFQLDENRIEILSDKRIVLGDSDDKGKKNGSSFNFAKKL